MAKYLMSQGNVKLAGVESLPLRQFYPNHRLAGASSKGHKRLRRA